MSVSSQTTVHFRLLQRGVCAPQAREKKTTAGLCDREVANTRLAEWRISYPDLRSQPNCNDFGKIFTFRDLPDFRRSDSVLGGSVGH